MRLHDGVCRYIDWKEATGYGFVGGKRILLAFSKLLGEVEMSEVTTEHILMFLNRTLISTDTWRLRFGILRRFFEYWSNRGLIEKLKMPISRPAVRRTFVPFVFTNQELRSVLALISEKLNSRTRTDKQTLRTMLLFLYGTGASIGEAVLVQCSDVDIPGGFVSLRSTRANRSRQIPIGRDLQEVLSEYLTWRSDAPYRSPYLFVTKRNRQMCSNTFAKSFARIRTQAGVCRLDGSKYQPRVDDLRYTFAVHRITKWIEQGADLNRMLPALAAYMGQVGLGSTERYLFLTPERFRKDLNKLSPSHGRGDWREDKALMKFLAAL